MAAYFRDALIVLVTSLLVSACGGGGGGGGGSSTPAPNTPPVASFTATPSSGTAPLSVQFDASTSSDPGGSIASYSWNFGDGLPTAAGVTVSHVYQTAGTYTVSLTVTDSLGATGSATKSVSVSWIIVPNVYNQTQAAATTAIVGAGLVVGNVTQQSSATVLAGRVSSQNPTAGVGVAAGSAVNLTISTGPAPAPGPVTVPNVVNQTQSAAITAITGAGLVLGTISQLPSATVPAGSVISQGPNAGTSVAAGSAVNLVVSSGPAVAGTPPELSISANPGVLVAGQTSLIEWTSRFATSCSASGGWSGAKPLSGSERTPPITSTTTFTMTCTGDGGVIVHHLPLEVNVLSGRLLISSISKSDSDVNDPDASYGSNDGPTTAQPLPNPVVVGGYVNEPNRGPAGRSFSTGDVDDIYKASLLAGQVIELVMPAADPSLPDSERDDADLGLYDENLVLVDASLGLGQVEQLHVPSSGIYYIQVNVYSGAPLYRLSIGQQSIAAASASLKLSDEFVPGEVIVTLKSRSAPVTTRQKSATSIESRHGLRKVAGDSSREILLTVPAGDPQAVQMNKPWLAERKAAGWTVPAKLNRKLETLQHVKALRTDPSIRAADLNRILRAYAVPNDPYYAIQRWHYEQINLPAAWNVTTGSPDVTVAVVDSGVVRQHPDLVSKIIGGYDFVSSASNPDGDGIDPDWDDPGCPTSPVPKFHGTHVAGTVAAATNNGLGVAGVAGNVRLMAVRVGDSCKGLELFDVAQGIRYAAGLSNDSQTLPSKRADVINLSLGAEAPCDVGIADFFAEIRAQGVTVVAAAGNQNSSSPTIPASCPGVISVSAVDMSRQKAWYSNYGASWVDVSAPGGDVSADLNGDGASDGVFSTWATGSGSNRLASYYSDNGTSMAAPHVAGVIALMKSVKPNLTPAEVDTLLAQGALTDDIGPVGPDDLGVGLINAYKAVTAVSGLPPQLPATLAVTPSSLNFGDVGTVAEVVAVNIGSGVLTVSSVTTSAAWLRAAPISVGADGLGRYGINVDRGGLTSGTYGGWVEFASSGGNVRVSVLMQVVTSAVVPNAGRQYVLLFDSYREEVSAQVAVQATGASVAYRFDAFWRGDYFVFAGTDMNNDGYICDDGEACGAYPIEALPQVVSVAGERSGVDFSSSYRTSLQATAASAAANASSYSDGKGYARRR